MESLRLSFEIGKNTEKLDEKLENLTGDRKILIEGASPPLKYQVVHFNPENNQFATQDQMKPMYRAWQERYDWSTAEQRCNIRADQPIKQAILQTSPGKGQARDRQLKMNEAHSGLEISV